MKIMKMAFVDRSRLPHPGVSAIDSQNPIPHYQSGLDEHLGDYA